MSINANDPRLTAYVLGELEGPDREEIEAQLSESAELRQSLNEIRGTADLLSQHLQDEPCPRLSDEQRQNVLNAGPQPAATAANQNNLMRVPLWRRPPMVGAALAASLVMCCALLWSHLSSRVSTDRRQLALNNSHETVAVVGERESKLADLSKSQIVDLETTHQNPTPVVAYDDNGNSSTPANRWGYALAVEAAPAGENGAKSADSFTRAKDTADHPFSPFGINSEGSPVRLRRVHPSVEPVLQEIVVGEGFGPGQGGDKYNPIEDNPFREVTNAPLSTFSIDVDTAAYSKVRMYLRDHNALPPRGAVRIEELINYFNYSYEGPSSDQPFAAHVEVAGCPWNTGHRLVRIGIKGRQIEREARPSSNLVFLLDVSGSMDQPNKLPLLKRSMKRLVDELGENDRVAIVVYAGAAGLVLPSTNGDQKQSIMDALSRLHAGGSTNGGQGIRLAYQTALDNFIPGGTNRVLLCTDGDFNVGTTSTSDLNELVSGAAKDGVFLSVLGFGIGNHNDAMLETISNQGNGNYAFIDTDAEARKVLSEQMSATLVTIAKDVKIQVEFNPARVASYRLIGYENRVLAAEDFNDDTKDAGEIGAGHTVTALYQIVPADSPSSVATASVDELRYQSKPRLTEQAQANELLTLKIRYKDPEADRSRLLSFPVPNSTLGFAQASPDFKFAASVAGFGMLLRDSPHKGDANFAAIHEIASSAAKESPSDYRYEFLDLIYRAKNLSGQ